MNSRSTLNRALRPVWAIALGILLGQFLPLGCHVIGSPASDGGSPGDRGGLADRGSPDIVQAQGRTVEITGSCSRGEVLVFDGGDRATCAEVRELSFPRCSDGEFLTTENGSLSCEGGSSTPWGIEGLLPDCSSGKILVSEGFGRWRCEDR